MKFPFFLSEENREAGFTQTENESRTILACDRNGANRVDRAFRSTIAVRYRSL
jgi:hypothetical protein